ncbi:hypothetical protein ACJIZ3_014689 [Penstemon smallii]|uniref:Uncharacterized protein n=1 Tax=Penstemon smallii TaxID=265156 RepID=A0ABD3RNQ9_9LAMI
MQIDQHQLEYKGRHLVQGVSTELKGRGCNLRPSSTSWLLLSTARNN